MIERVGVRCVPVSSHALQDVRGGRRKIRFDGGPGREGPTGRVGESAKETSGDEAKGTSAREKPVAPAQSRARVRGSAGRIQVRFPAELLDETSTLRR